MEKQNMCKWKNVLTLNAERRVCQGSSEALSSAIRNGADMRIYTEFRHNEHIDVTSNNNEIIQEVSDFRVTYLIDDRWTAGIMNLRQPISLPDGFGPRPSMSFFLYNENGQQAIARPYLDGPPIKGNHGSSSPDSPLHIPKYHTKDNWDVDTNAPSSNFVYEFETYRFFVLDEWEEVFAHDPKGKVVLGSLDRLVESFTNGCDVKVGVRGLCADLSDDPARAVEHEIFVQIGPCYYYTEKRLFIAGSQPVVRVKPAIPLRYESNGWDFGWLMLRTDGFVALLLYDPYTLIPCRRQGYYAIRWFVR